MNRLFSPKTLASIYFLLINNRYALTISNHGFHGILSGLRLLCVLMVVFLLYGCALFNSVERLPMGGEPSADRAVVVYGISIEGGWHAPRFEVALDEYSLKQQKILGDCWRFNRTEASVPAIPGTVQYFAFDVPTGHYAYSGFNGVPMNGSHNAFVVPKGKAVNFGVFVYTRDQMVELRRDLAAERKKINDALPKIKESIVLAETLSVQAPRIFLCAP